MFEEKEKSEDDLCLFEVMKHIFINLLIPMYWVVPWMVQNFPKSRFGIWFLVKFGKTMIFYKFEWESFPVDQLINYVVSFYVTCS